MFNHALAKPAEAARESYQADVAGPIRPLGIGQAKYVLAVVGEYTRYQHVLPMRRKVRQPHCLHSCLSAFVYKLFDRNMLVY